MAKMTAAIPETIQYVGMTAPGGPEVLTLASGPVPRPAAGEVLIRVAAAGVNRPDILQRTGNYPPPPGASPILGLEVAGTIAALGPGVAEWREGDAVCALVAGGGYAEYCVAPAPQCLPVPKSLSVVAAAGLPETFFTVWSNVFDRGRLAAGESFLVHGGSSGIGTTAIQLTHAFGARVFATAGSAEKCAVCRDLGAERAIDYRQEDFVAVIKQMTQGRGVDVILDMVGGPYIERNLRSLAVEGRLVQIAFLQGSKVTLDLANLMVRRQTITGSTLRPRPVADKAAIARQLRDKVWPLIEAGKVRPVIDRTFPLAEAAAAHRLMESSAHIGKILLVTWLRETAMRILVLGAGAVGGYFGGRLAEAGRDVTFLVRAPRAAALSEGGLKVASPLGDFQVPVKVATADRVGGPYDLVVLTAKHYDLDAAIATIRPAVGPDTAVLPLLNGLVHLDRLDAAFGPERVLGGVAYVGAVLLPDGSIRHVNRLSGIAHGERPREQNRGPQAHGGVSERTKAIEQEFTGTPVAAPANDNILLEMWEKFVMIGAMAGMNCLMRGTLGEILATEEGEALTVEALGECQRIAEAAGYSPRPQNRERVQAMLTERGSVNSASMRQDLEAGRRTEADAIIGDLLRRARRSGVATPLLRTVSCHLQVHENRLAAKR